MKKALEPAPDGSLCLRYRSITFAVFAALIFATTAQASPERPGADDDRLVIASSSLLSDTALDEKRGSGGPSTVVTVSSTQTMNSTTSGNTLNVGGSLTNGSIANGNFGGSGFGSYVMNTGNNSTINSGVSLSVLMMQ